MVSLIIYSIKSALCLTILYLPFSLFLRNEKRHRLNRIVLLSILAVSFIIPSIHIEWNNASVMSISTNSARIGQRTISTMRCHRLRWFRMLRKAPVKSNLA